MKRTPFPANRSLIPPRYQFLMLAVLAAAAPAARSHPEWSDLCLFAVAATAVWLVRRSLRARFRARD